MAMAACSEVPQPVATIGSRASAARRMAETRSAICILRSQPMKQPIGEGWLDRDHLAHDVGGAATEFRHLG